MNHPYRIDALAPYRERQAPRDPSRWFLLALTLVGVAGPLLALFLGA